MKRFVLFAAGLALCASDLAIAQQQAQQGERRPRPDRSERPTTKPAPPNVRPDRPNPGRPDRPNPGKPNPGKPNPGRPGGPQIQPPRPGGPQIQPPRPGRPGANRPRPPHRPGVRPPGGWNRPPHRPGFRPPNFRPIRGPAFRYPRGYAYRRWTVGLLLPSLFLGSAYRYNDYGALGVGPPPYGYRWVRYGPDLLLINVRTRRVRDVIYGAFY